MRDTLKAASLVPASSRVGAHRTVGSGEGPLIEGDRTFHKLGSVMQKWNMIVDVAECTNCNLCTLATMDEYVGNDSPGYATRCRRHGHKWIHILQKERGQVPMIDMAYVPTRCAITATMRRA